MVDDRRIGWTTLAASFGFALVQLDVTVVNVALPTIAGELGTGVAGLQWVVDAYALAFAALLLSAGHLGDRFGAKRIYLAGLALFAAASAGCGWAANAPMLIAMRVLQGIGAAAMLPTSLALINHAAAGRPDARAKAIGWWTAAGGVTIAAGPIVGGALLGTAGWRSIFLVNLPVCLAAAVMARPVAETGRLPDDGGFDVPGQVLGVVALGGIVAAVIAAKPLGFAGGIVPALAVAGVAAAVAFVRHEGRTAHPMLPLALFRAPGFAGAVAYGAAVNFTYYGVVFLLSLYLQRVLGYRPVSAGLAFLPLTATFIVVNVISGWWVARAGSRPPMIVGALVDAGGFVILACVAGPATPYAALLPAFLLIPGGMGLGVPAMTTAVMAGAASGRAGTASAVLNAARQAAGATGVALFGALAGDAPSHVVDGLHLAAPVAVACLAGAAIAAWRTAGLRHREAR